MNRKISQPILPNEKAQSASAQSEIGQSDTKEIIFLAAGLITLVLGLGGVLMYSEEEPLPTLASQEAAKEVSTNQMAKGFVTSESQSATSLPHESPTPLETEPSVQLVTSASETQEVGDTNVYFAFNRWALSDEAKALIKTQVEAQPEGWSGTLHIDGHTDAQGTDSYNRALGLRRAKSVKTYLMALGIPEERIQVRSFGKDGAVCQEATPECFENNRRAHVAFLSEPAVQQDDTLLSMTPDALEDSTPEESAPIMDHQPTEDSNEEMLVQEEIPGELVAVDPLVSTESLP